jgi:protein phosphatase
MRLVAWAASDIGKKRDHNEDSHLVDAGLGLFAVADGMGGHQGGDRASRMAVEVLRAEIAAYPDVETGARAVRRGEITAATPRAVPVAAAYAGDDDLVATPPMGTRLKELLKLSAPGAAPVERRADEPLDEVAEISTDPALLLPEAAPPEGRPRGEGGAAPAAAVLRAAARAAGRAIYDAGQGDASLAGMGTTLTAVLFHRDRAHIVHVGDSRALLIRDGQVTQLTEDHSWIAEQVRAGVLSEREARESKFRHIITRSVGFEREVDVDLFGIPVLPGDCFLLCSDGMSNHVTIDEIGRIAGTTYYSKVPQLLVDLANDRGGDDNITVVLVYVANEAPEAT